GDVENEFLQERMHQRRAAGSARHPYRQRPRGAVEANAQAIVVARISVYAGEMEIAGLVGGGRPAFNERTECRRNGRDDAASTVANGEDVSAWRFVIRLLQARRQRKPRAAVRIGYD